MKLQWRCWIGRHDLETTDIISDLTIARRCTKCGVDFLTTIAAGPEIVMRRDSSLARSYLTALRALQHQGGGNG
jgi:hypothetical protein